MSPHRKTNDFPGMYGGSNGHLNANGGSNGRPNEPSPVLKQNYIPQGFQKY